MLDLERYAAMQQMNQGRPPQQGGGQMPPMPSAPPPAPYNPITAGTLQGMKAAKDSIRLDDEQRQNAMKMGLSSFITAAARPGTGSGFSGFLRSVAQGMTPGMNAYNQEEARAQANNHVLLSNQLEMERQHRKELWDRERAAVKDEFDRQRLGIMGERNKIHEKMLKQKFGDPLITNETLETPYGKVTLGNYPKIDSVRQKNMIAQRFKDTGAVDREFKEMKKDLEELKKATEGNVFAPTGSIVGGIANKAKSAAGILLNSVGSEKEFAKNLHKENVLRARLNSKFERLQPQLEKAWKGTSAGEQMMKRFHESGALPDIRQPMNILEDRINELSEFNSKEKELSRLSLMKGRFIDDFEGPGEGGEGAGEGGAGDENVDISDLQPEAAQQILQGINAKFPQLNKFDDETKLKWAKSRGLF